MCLIAQANIKPCVAQKNLKVVKLLGRQEDDSFVTPFQGVPVTLNSILYAEGYCDSHTSEHNNCRKNITSGFVHAKLRIEQNDKDGNIVCVVAYIPRGTEYFVNIYASEVCAKQLLITDEIVDLYTFSLTKDELMDATEQFIYELIPTDKVAPGWLLTAEKQFVHPLDCKGGIDVIGVVATTDDNGKTSTVFALDEKELTWDDGVEYCKAYKTNGTKVGDWTLPDKDVLQSAFEKHIIQINLALVAIGEVTLSGWYYWASAGYSSADVWDCGTSGATLSTYSSEWVRGYVRPSFAINA